MHPAYSVIFFTVSSGMGFGLFIWLGLAPMLGIAPSSSFGWIAFIWAFSLSVAGLLSSTQHLGHPERAWRALTQWRTSWLSREGICAIITLVLAGLYALSSLFLTPIAILGLAVSITAFGTVWTTAMIYQQLKTVDRWHTPLTLLCYLGFAFASGGFLFLTLLSLTQEITGSWLLYAAALLVIAWGLKLAWWRTGDRKQATSTPESATGLGFMGKVRLLESPHTGQNYLQKEMGYQIARKHRNRLRKIAVILGAGIPLVALSLALIGVPSLVLILGLAGLTVGLLTERWVFFAEAEHSVMTYYR